MDKCSGQDDTGSEVTSKQIDVHGDFEAWCAASDDGEERGQGGTDEDHKYG